VLAQRYFPTFWHFVFELPEMRCIKRMLSTTNAIIVSLRSFVSPHVTQRYPSKTDLSSRYVIWLLLAGMTLLSQVSQVSAQTPPINVDIERMYSVRSEGPITLRVRLTPNHPTLVEGRLEFRLFNGNELISTLISGDEVINPPAKTARYVLPAPEISGYSQQLDLAIQFVTKQGRYQFPPVPILVPKYRERDFIVGVVTPPNRTASAEIDLLLQSLKLENFSPVDGEQNPIDKTVHTILSNFSPDQLPPDAMGYTAFNMLVIAGDGFAALRESQWPPLLDWVEAGGSVCLMPGNDLTEQHITALNQLVQHRSDKITFLLGRDSDVVLKNDETETRQLLLNRGLGKIAIVPLIADQPLDPNSPTWRRVVGHLWKLRHDQATSLVGTGRWDSAVLSQQDAVARATRPNYDYYRSTPDQQRRLAAIPLSSGDHLVQAIMPSDLRIIPLSMIAFILFLYVLAIGPADYLILGRLKMRKWTWVTFPVTTIVFAGGALWMAEWYMNTGDARRSVYFVDIGIEGRPERYSQFEMLFNSRQRVVDTPLRGSSFTPLNHQDYGGNSYQNQFRQNGISSSLGATKPEITGRVPSNFTARQMTPKWVPQLNRITSIISAPRTTSESDGDTEKPKPNSNSVAPAPHTDQPWLTPKLDWQQFARKDSPEWSALFADPEWKKSLVDPIRAAFPSPDLVICVCAGGKFLRLYGNSPLFQPADRYGTRYSGQPTPPAYNSQNLESEPNFISDVSMLQDGGLFGVVSSIAPHGGRQLEDLSLVDPSDSRQWLLIVSTSEGGNWYVYRKLYAGIE